MNVVVGGGTGKSVCSRRTIARSSRTSVPEAVRGSEKRELGSAARVGAKICKRIRPLRRARRRSCRSDCERKQKKLARALLVAGARRRPADGRRAQVSWTLAGVSCCRRSRVAALTGRRFDNRSRDDNRTDVAQVSNKLIDERASERSSAALHRSSDY